MMPKEECPTGVNELEVTIEKQLKNELGLFLPFLATLQCWDRVRQGAGK